MPCTAAAQELPDDVRTVVAAYLDTAARQARVQTGHIRIDSAKVDGKTLQLFANIECSYISFREGNVAEIYKDVKALLPADYAKYRLQIRTDGRSIEELIPQALRAKKDKKEKVFDPARKDVKPLVTDISKPWQPTEGLYDRHIAMWQSHGKYYEPKRARWEWQRGRLMETVEDLYTQSYVLPFLIPMLENAGANVLIPRERDTNRHEVIVDNDGGVDSSSVYLETTGDKPWAQAEGQGFAYLHKTYKDFENPFRDGTFRQVETVKGKKAKESTAEWIPDIPADGQYAVYVAYKTVANSTDDALYTVYHKGGRTQFRVNQQMGGGTWIYLGTFGFEQGRHEGGKVVLSNLSADKAGRIVTADAVKIGGGMGNIARRVSEEGATENVRSSDTRGQTQRLPYEVPKIDYPYVTSGLPRFCEGARYWLQWAGVPDSIYSPSHGLNDYTDDYRCRGLWVNYLAGGSASYPSGEGLHIPIDLSLAFHSDAGTTMNDSIIGTLAIYQTDTYGGVFENGASRYLSHDLADLVQSSIVRDIRSLYEPNWTRRGMWNQPYFEARVPRVPAMLLELLSHQNFADMRYGLDPRFRFTVSRAIYKGFLHFIASQYGTSYVVQPLPVDDMNLQLLGEDKIKLTWQAVPDS
ncbi:MAG: xanthan lyase, partial [Tannerella sp.]|nr:xanthan lyase [Tannerella sp.]